MDKSSTFVIAVVGCALVIGCMFIYGYVILGCWNYSETYAYFNGVPEWVLVSPDNYDECRCIVDAYVKGREDALANKSPCYTPVPECAGWGYTWGYSDASGLDSLEVRDAQVKCAYETWGD